MGTAHPPARITHLRQLIKVERCSRRGTCTRRRWGSEQIMVGDEAVLIYPDAGEDGGEG